MPESPVAPSPLIFDRRLIRARRRRAASMGAATFLLDRAAADLADRLAAVLRRFELALDLGTPGEAVRAALARLGSVGTIVAAGAAPPNGGAFAPAFVVADEEALPFRDAAFDLVVSALALQFVNDLPGVLVQIRRALKPDGLFLAALLGGETLTELRQSFAAAESDIEGGASPRVAPFADLRDLGALLQRGRRPRHGALRLRFRADARSAAHGCDQRNHRSSPHAAQACDADAGGGDLRPALFR
jgi:SAM-dependent methyltransferase